MDIPEYILKQAKENIEPYDVEGFVLGAGNESSDLMIVGEAPGENEIIEGVPFNGRAGKELDKQLERLELKRREVYITSTVRSRPFRYVQTKTGKRKANRKPNKKEITAHAALLDYQIEKVDPSIIIALGGVAYQRLTGEKKRIKDVVGHMIDTSILQWQEGEWVSSEKTYTVVPLYHPAAVFYNPKIRTDIENSLDYIKKQLKRKE